MGSGGTAPEGYQALLRMLDPIGGLALVTLAAVVLLVSSHAFEFSWRYQLPAVVMLPLAGALGLTVARARGAARAGTADRQGQTVPLRGTARLTR